MPPPSTTPDTQGKKRFAFRDVRTDVELLASGRPPKSLQFKKGGAASKKLSKLTNKIRGGIVRAGLKALTSKALPLAAKAAFGPVGGAVAAQVAGKYGGPLLNRLGGKLLGKFSSFTKSANALGVAIAEELTPSNIRRPLGSYKDGLSNSPSAAAAPLSATMANSVLKSLVSGASMAAAIPQTPRIFKTAASLVKSPRFFNPNNRQFTLNSDEKSKAEKAVRHVTISTPDERLYPQAGLLEDEIFYRLTLLAENVYAPVRQYLIASPLGSAAGLEILEGFRVENSASSQHEKGEAMDITVDNDPVKCFYLAQWMRDHIVYDQLILCHDISGQSWIHVSFTIEGRRRQVLTKTFNDTFVEGLHVYTPTTGISAQTQADITAGENFIDLLSKRQQRLQPVGLDTDLPQQSSDLLNSSVAQSGGCEGTPVPVPNEEQTVWAVYNRGGWNFTTSAGGGEFVEAVIDALGPEWGHIRKSSDRTNHNGHAEDAIMYKSAVPLAPGKFGQVVDIIAAVRSTNARPQWLPICGPVTGDDWYR